MFTRVSHVAHRILDAADVLFTAARVSGAVDRGTRPSARDLERLGIAPRDFAAIRLS